MKYSTEIIIHIPLTNCIKKLNNVENRKYWQKDLTSFEHVSGIPGVIGSKMKLNYTLNKRNIELIETITKSNLPYELFVTYDTVGMHNMQKNYFSETADGYTKWISVNEFRATSFLQRLMILLMPKAFQKQSEKYLQDFKEYAENEIQ